MGFNVPLFKTGLRLEMTKRRLAKFLVMENRATEAEKNGEAIDTTRFKFSEIRDQKSVLNGMTKTQLKDLESRVKTVRKLGGFNVLPFLGSLVFKKRLAGAFKLVPRLNECMHKLESLRKTKELLTGEELSATIRLDWLGNFTIDGDMPVPGRDNLLLNDPENAEQVISAVEAILEKYEKKSQMQQAKASQVECSAEEFAAVDIVRLESLESKDKL